MPINAEPYAEKKFLEINGSRMAYIDEGEGDAIIFQHGNPTSSYLWRNVMPHCEELGRLVACDLIGMGDSDKLSPSGPNRYTYVDQRDYLYKLWDALDLGDRVILVVHDWGSALGFEWAMRNPERVQGVAYMESLVKPIGTEVTGDGDSAATMGAIQSEAGEKMILEDNLFVEYMLPDGILRDLSEAEMNEYRRPFTNPGEDRRPTLTWPRQLPVEGGDSPTNDIVETYGRWLSQSEIPKLFINAEPGRVTVGAARDCCRSWPNQREVTVEGSHFIQEDSPDEIGQALAEWIRDLRGG